MEITHEVKQAIRGTFEAIYGTLIECPHCLQMVDELFEDCGICWDCTVQFCKWPDDDMHLIDHYYSSHGF